MDKIKVCSFNCKGFYSSQLELLELCKCHNIICLQEIWLDKVELQNLNTFHPSFCGFGVSPVDPSAGLIRGRKYGGVAFLWDKVREENVYPIDFGYDWIAGIRLMRGKTVINLIGVYMPCDSKHNIDSFLVCFGVL